MYLNYDEYEQMNGTLEEEVFAPLAMRAQKLIDRMTHGRLQGEESVRESVKQAMFCLIGAMAEADSHGGRAVQALTNDGVSIKYMPGSVLLQYRQIVREFLADEKSAAGVGLMYAGVDA